jgi:hypothetical protein
MLPAFYAWPVEMQTYYFDSGPVYKLRGLYTTGRDTLPQRSEVGACEISSDFMIDTN